MTGSCNSSTSFSCGDYTCIPLSYQCDGVPDCQTELDEKYCDAAIPHTCQDWYNVGYRENGIYKICKMKKYNATLNRRKENFFINICTVDQSKLKL